MVFSADAHVLSPNLIAALTLLVFGGPLLAFPDVIPAPWRIAAITPLALAALGIGAWLLSSWKPLRPGLWIFAAAVVASWTIMPRHDVVGLRHFAGIGLGVLAMGVVAAWSSTVDRLITAAAVFALGAAGILAVGLVGTLIFPSKFMGSVRIIPETIYFHLPRLKLGLPGLQQNGHVNPNALGGTAVLLMPACIGLAAAARRRGRRIAVLAGVTAAAVGSIVLALTLSRTAWIAAALTLAVLGLRWRRGQRWVLVALLLGAAALVYQATRSRAAAPADFETGTIVTSQSAATRIGIWRDALTEIRRHPWLGVGINQFHRVTPTASNDGMQEVPHAHNVLLQIALDIGLIGLCGYVWLIGRLLVDADRASRAAGPAGRIAAGAGLSIVGLHFFGIADTIALGAKAGLFQWLAAGLILAAARLAAVSAVSEGPGGPRP